MPNSSQTDKASLLDYIKAWPLYLVPHHAISRLVLRLTRIQTGKDAVIRWFVRQFDVDMQDAVNPDTTSYTHFNEFFTRPLKDAARPIIADPLQIACPADGTVSALGPVDNNRVYQAKGHDYSLTQLLGGEAEEAQRYNGGSFMTVYLSPRDYHRIHCPLKGTLRKQTYVPGRLFSVAPHTVKTVPGLFARNERVIAHFDTAEGDMAVILVGAINVAAIETVWDGLVTPPAGKKIRHTVYSEKNIKLDKGEELGRFNMGSTVILVFSQGVNWRDRLSTGTAVKMGEGTGQFNKS